MALYEYRCTACNKSMEVVRPMSEVGKAIVCDCGGIAEQLLSRFNFSMGTRKAKTKGDMMTLGDFPDRNEWVDA